MWSGNFTIPSSNTFIYTHEVNYSRYRGRHLHEIVSEGSTVSAYENLQDSPILKEEWSEAALLCRIELNSQPSKMTQLR